MQINSLQDFVAYNKNKHDGYPADFSRVSKSVNITYNDLDRELEYRENCNFIRFNMHHGQRKLFLSELQFLTLMKATNELVVYAGAAPGEHIPLLQKYFPQIKLFLIDPSKFKMFCSRRLITGYNKGELYDYLINCVNKLFVYNGVMTNELADEFAGKNVLFICDIRTAVFNTSEPTELDVLWNLSQQYNWMCRMRPRASYVKFRYPWKLAIPEIPQYMHDDFRESRSGMYGPAIDFLQDYQNGVLKYPAGTIYLQAYAPPSSAETRLLVQDVEHTKDWGSSKSYENKFSYFNNVTRSLTMFPNKWANCMLGYDYSADCALESYIWEQYDANINIAAQIKGLSAYFHRKHFMFAGHGYLTESVDERPKSRWLLAMADLKKNEL